MKIILLAIFNPHNEILITNIIYTFFEFNLILTSSFNFDIYILYYKNLDKLIKFYFTHSLQ